MRQLCCLKNVISTEHGPSPLSAVLHLECTFAITTENASCILDLLSRIFPERSTFAPSLAFTDPEEQSCTLGGDKGEGNAAGAGRASNLYNSISKWRIKIKKK